jgi:hypothetical protein
MLLSYESEGTQLRVTSAFIHGRCICIFAITVNNYLDNQNDDSEPSKKVAFAWRDDEVAFLLPYL